MSTRERRHLDRAARHLCASCRERRAKFQYRGRVRADRDHVLCFQCFRSQTERMRAQAIKGTAPIAENGDSPRFPRELTVAQIAHRQAMLAHLQSQAR